ncbi:hypothetical protein BHS09_19090 [Myxococcus xanthus]|uniref:Uncharacterized protein n=1 Tax=Myxococcus xanthus TaxID=34 RepID=A0AAE6KT14_MYXXA|nr:hypothetical protein [Myxococcus xanthus]QDE68917.1 hypothetical protein BHS09_19090 [Myxococcus xanthus]QDE76193.1 hypothetical protein BHS08_19105 [Myxococcus xanthus]
MDRRRQRELQAEHADAVAHWSLVRDVLIAGGLVGTLGAWVMAALALLLGGITQGDLWYAPRLVGGVVFRHAPAGAAAVVLGFVLHFATAGGLATAFAMLVPRGGTALAAVMLGLLAGLTLQAVMPVLVVPWAAPPLERAGPPIAAFLLLHLVFGACLGVLTPVRKVLLHMDAKRRGVRALPAPPP